LFIFILWTLYFEIIYYVLGVYDDQFEADGDFSDINKFFGLFFVSFGNSVGDYRPPSYDAEKTNVVTKVLIYTMFFFNMVLNNIVLLNFVIALISQVYEQVMDSQTMHIYI